MESRLRSQAKPGLRWTEKAFGSLEAAVLYVATENPKAATALAAKIYAAVTALQEHPLLGRPGRCNGTRELVITGTPYIVSYRIKAGHVEILRVLHGSRRWPLSL